MRNIKTDKGRMKKNKIGEKLFTPLNKTKLADFPNKKAKEDNQAAKSPQKAIIRTIFGIVPITRR